MQNMYEAGVGLAHEVNDSLDLIGEYRAVKTSLEISERDRTIARRQILGTLHLDVLPEDFNDCDMPELYEASALEIAEQARFNVLIDLAATLINSALAVEGTSSRLRAS